MAQAKTRVVVDSGNGREFWIGLGEKLGRVESLEKKLETFMTNDHAHLCRDVKELEGKIDKLAVRIAYIVGGISALSFVVQVVVRLLK